MQENRFPRYDASPGDTGCCPRLVPGDWDGQVLHFRDKPFIHAETHSIMHMPLDMGEVFARILEKMPPGAQGAPVVLSRERTPWIADHYFEAAAPLPGERTVTLSGDFITRVFEDAEDLSRPRSKIMAELVAARGGEPSDIYFFHTTCPTCAEAYGRSYVVGIARI